MSEFYAPDVGFDPEEPRLDSYWFSLVPTGVIEIDRILSAVARAGKFAHSTEHWGGQYGDYPEGTVVPIDFIQEAANRAAADFEKARRGDSNE